MWWCSCTESENAIKSVRICPCTASVEVYLSPNLLTTIAPANSITPVIVRYRALSTMVPSHKIACLEFQRLRQRKHVTPQGGADDRIAFCNQHVATRTHGAAVDLELVVCLVGSAHVEVDAGDISSLRETHTRVHLWRQCSTGPNRVSTEQERRHVTYELDVLGTVRTASYPEIVPYLAAG